MSRAGIQSNRGDGYQTLVAFDWAITVLSNPDFQWLEIDSVAWLVDDVVVGKADGVTICCQCKKNQSGFKAWTISDLADELIKASKVLVLNQRAQIVFYSRSPFGEINMLHECSINYGSESEYLSGLGEGARGVDQKLRELLDGASQGISTYDFLRRLNFSVSENLEQMQTRLLERLRQLVSNPTAAYSALWTRLDHLGMRLEGSYRSTTAQHRLTKQDLIDLVSQAGAMIIPPMDIALISASFRSASAIGRAWKRDIGSISIACPLVGQIIEAVNAKTRSILLTGAPGSGKTCVMLTLQEELERIARVDGLIQPLFIQSREFADIASSEDRKAHGLSENWVGEVARMADIARVVVVIDSLDVLSIAREHGVLKYFLAQIDRLLLVPGVTVIASCREFDRHYDRQLAHRNWEREFVCEPLDWSLQILPLFSALGIDAACIDITTREIIKNPRQLDLYVELARKDGIFNAVTSQALAYRYLDVIVLQNHALGLEAIQAIESMAVEMLQRRSLAVPKQRFEFSSEVLRALLSHNVLRETEDGQLTFGHQTLLDVLVVSGAIRKGDSLNQFIQSLPSVPFVRPSIRSFISQLALGERQSFRKQLRTVLLGNLPFHVRRLVAESFSEMVPHDDDWVLLRDLWANRRDVFQVIYASAVRIEWHYFWLRNLVPMLVSARDVEGVVMHVHRVSLWCKQDPENIIQFWDSALDLEWVEKSRVAQRLGIYLSDFNEEHAALMGALLVRLIDLPAQDIQFLGRALSRCVNSGGIDDVILWRYVTNEVCEANIASTYSLGKLKCGDRHFGKDHDQQFLSHRMKCSPTLLDLVVGSIEHWSELLRARYSEPSKRFWDGFLHQTSYEKVREVNEFHHVDEQNMLFDAVEAAIVHCSINNTDWWNDEKKRLCLNAEGSLRYFGIRACIAAPLNNIEIIGHLLKEKELLESTLSYELCLLLNQAYVFIDLESQDQIQNEILNLYAEERAKGSFEPWMRQRQIGYLAAIPSYLRSPEALLALGDNGRLVWSHTTSPRIVSRGGFVRAPFSFDVFLQSGDLSVLRLLLHYFGYSRSRSHFDDFLIGGEEEVGRQLCEAASRAPLRFLSFLSRNYWSIPEEFRRQIMSGVGYYFAYQYGALQNSNGWAPVENPDGFVLMQGVLEELRMHSVFWTYSRPAAEAIQGCAYLVRTLEDAEQITFLAIAYVNFVEESPILGETKDWFGNGINMQKGCIVIALMEMALALESAGLQWPEMLRSALL